MEFNNENKDNIHNKYEVFNYGEIVDIILNSGEVEAGLVKSVRGRKLIVNIINNYNSINNKELIYDTNSSNILKRWKVGNKLHINNRVDYLSKSYNKYIIGTVKEIENRKITIYNNKNNEIITFSRDDLGKKVFEAGKFSKYTELNNTNIYDLFNLDYDSNNNNDNEFKLNSDISQNFVNKNKMNTLGMLS